MSFVQEKKILKINKKIPYNETKRNLNKKNEIFHVYDLNVIFLVRVITTN